MILEDNTDILKNPVECRYEQLERLLQTCVIVFENTLDGQISVVGKMAQGTMYYCHTQQMRPYQGLEEPTTEDIFAVDLPGLFLQMALVGGLWEPRKPLSTE